ncbi:MAG: alcohol dehydrogenase catalytic domain-containing protein [Candidatus Hydrogenedentota bacterium]
MKGLYVRNRTLRFRDDLALEERPGEVLLEPVLSGICRTDIELVHGYMDFTGVPGHEFVARVVEGSDSFRAGELVVGEINCGCGSCADCATNRARHCATRTVLGILNRPGCMAERFHLPERNLWRVPAGVAPEEAVFAEPLAAACRIIEQDIIPGGSDVAVLGDGKLGVLCAFVLARHGHRVSLFGHHAGKRRALFAGTGVAVRDAEDWKDKFAFIVESTGRAEGMAQAIEHLEPRGTLILKTTTFLPPQFHLARIVIDEFRVVGSRCGPFDMALRLIAEKSIPVAGMIEAEYPLEDGLAAFQRAAERGALKVLLRAGV